MFETLNKDKPITEQIKPFNFLTVGITAKDKVKPITSFTKNAQVAVHQPFLDYKTGQMLRRSEYWQPLSDLILSYVRHPESKLRGNTGVLERRHLKIANILHIGKETKNIDKQALQKQHMQHYVNLKKLLEITPAQARTVDVSKSTLYDIKQKIKHGKTPNPRTKAVKKLLLLVGRVVSSGMFEKREEKRGEI